MRRKLYLICAVGAAILAVMLVTGSGSLAIPQPIPNENPISSSGNFSRYAFKPSMPMTAFPIVTETKDQIEEQTCPVRLELRSSFGNDVYPPYVLMH